MNIAIVTGASAGLGTHFVESLIRTGPRVDTIWLVARRQERLVRLAERFPDRAFEIVPLDLASQSDREVFAEKLEREQPEVKLLVNNAGLLTAGPFAQSDKSALQAEIAVNTAAPVALCRAVIPYLPQGSAIINVSSVSGFAPLASQAVYSASKAFVCRFSLALRAELRAADVNVMAVCPGNMKTEMNQGPSSGSTSTETGLLDSLPFLDLPRLTRKALHLAFHGRAVYTPHPVYKAYRVLAKCIPHRILTRVIRI